jgi:hypothetical protein
VARIAGLPIIIAKLATLGLTTLCFFVCLEMYAAILGALTLYSYDKLFSGGVYLILQN